MIIFLIVEMIVIKCIKKRMPFDLLLDNLHRILTRMNESTLCIEPTDCVWSFHDLESGKFEYTI